MLESSIDFLGGWRGLPFLEVFSVWKKAWILWRKHQCLGASWFVLVHTSALIASSRVKKSYLLSTRKNTSWSGVLLVCACVFPDIIFWRVSQDVSSTEVSQVKNISLNILAWRNLLPICWCSDMLVVSCLSFKAVGVLYALTWVQKQKEMQKHHFFGRKLSCFKQSLGVRNTSSVAGTSSCHISKTCTFADTLENIGSASF